MKEALGYIREHCHIGNVLIKFNPKKPQLTLQETVNISIDFPAPMILVFWSMSSHQTHSVVVSNKRVYDLQEQNAYHLTEKSLIQKLNGDSMLVSARYFYLLQPKKINIASCPSKMMIDSSCVPYYRSLIDSFGNKTMKKKRRRKRKHSAMY